MKIKKEYIILIAVIGALSLYLYMHESNQTHYQLPELKNIPSMEISKLEIIKPSDTITMNRKSGKWYIDSEAYPANFEKVQNILKVVEELRIDTLVSEAKTYNRYDLTDDKRITVKAYNNDKVTREFDIGKAAGSIRHTFVKLAGNPNVYHARNNFRSKFDVTVNDLRDKSVLTFDKDTINELSIAQGDQQTIFKHQAAPVDLNVSDDKKTPPSDKKGPPESIWMRQDSKTADSAKIKSLLTALEKLTCEEYINDKTKADFKEPIHTVTLKGAEEFQISIYAQRESDKKNEKYPATSSANAYAFLLPKWKVDQIMKKPDDLLPPDNKTKAAAVDN